MKRTYFLIAVSLLLNACGRHEPSATTSSEATDQQPTPAHVSSDLASSVELPPGLQFNPSVRVAVADTWNQRLDAMPAAERAMLQDIDARYFGALRFNSTAEQADLAKKGFPMPEEWVAASRLSNEELKALANSGNVKAQMLYADRLGTEIASLQNPANDPDLSSDQRQRELMRVVSEALGGGAKMMRATDSPFAAYVYGRSLSGATAGGRPEAMAGAFFAARDRGDARAPALMATFTRLHPDMNTQTIMSAYSAMTTLSARR